MPTKTAYEMAKERKCIADDIRDQSGGAGAVCFSQAMRYLGLQKDAAREFLQAIEPKSFRVQKGGKKALLG